jgi:hypothetical protein
LFSIRRYQTIYISFLSFQPFLHTFRFVFERFSCFSPFGFRFEYILSGFRWLHAAFTPLRLRHFDWCHEADRASFHFRYFLFDISWQLSLATPADAFISFRHYASHCFISHFRYCHWQLSPPRWWLRHYRRFFAAWLPDMFSLLISPFLRLMLSLRHLSFSPPWQNVVFSPGMFRSYAFFLSPFHAVSFRLRLLRWCFIFPASFLRWMFRRHASFMSHCFHATLIR